MRGGTHTEDPSFLPWGAGVLGAHGMRGCMEALGCSRGAGVQGVPYSERSQGGGHPTHRGRGEAGTLLTGVAGRQAPYSQGSWGGGPPSHRGSGEAGPLLTGVAGRRAPYLQGSQEGELTEGVGSDFPDAVVLEAARAARGLLSPGPRASCPHPAHWENRRTQLAEVTRIKGARGPPAAWRSEEHTSELQSQR